MTRIDHIGESRACENAGLSILRNHEMLPHMEAVMQFDLARLYAQRALVEQQRIANMQAERQSLRARAIGRHDAEAVRLSTDADALDAEIREALGLT